MFLYVSETKMSEFRSPCNMILDCHWLVCVRGEGLTDRSIDMLGRFVGTKNYRNVVLTKTAITYGENI